MFDRIHHHMSLVMRKPVFRVCDQVRHKPVAQPQKLGKGGCAGWSALCCSHMAWTGFLMTWLICLIVFICQYKHLKAVFCLKFYMFWKSAILFFWRNSYCISGYQKYTEYNDLQSVLILVDQLIFNAHRWAYIHCVIEDELPVQSLKQIYTITIMSEIFKR